MRDETSSLAGVKNESNLTRGVRLSTEDISAHERRDWLEHMICQEFTRVAVTLPSDGKLFNETTLYGWNDLRLSVVRSRGLTIERLRHEPYYQHQDNYLAVVLVSGNYALEQNGREVFLQPGDMTIYDTTRPHRIWSSAGFSKLLVSIPRTLMRERVAGIEHCVALPVSGETALGGIAAQFIQTVARDAERMRGQEFGSLSTQSLDLLTLAFRSIRPQNITLSRSRSVSLYLVKEFIARHLPDTWLDTEMVATGTRLSPRYINDLFKDEDTSLMRYVWASRLDKAKQEILDLTDYSVTMIACKWGFSDMSHFSRAFKKRFGLSPTDMKRLVNLTR